MSIFFRGIKIFNPNFPIFGHFYLFFKIITKKKRRNVFCNLMCRFFFLINKNLIEILTFKCIFIFIYLCLLHNYNIFFLASIRVMLSLSVYYFTSSFFFSFEGVVYNLSSLKNFLLPKENFHSVCI